MGTRIVRLPGAALAAVVACAAPAPARALDVGSLQWSFAAGQPIAASPAIGRDGTVYVGSRDGKLYALAPEGTLRWSFDAGAPIGAAPAVGADGTLYVGSTDGKLHAVTPEGGRRWSFSGGDVFSVPAFGDGGEIYAGNRDHRLYALTPQGKLRWSFAVAAEVAARPSSPAVGADGTIYLGGYDGRLHALTARGAPRWSVRVDGDPVLASPALAADGTIYVTNADLGRRVYTLRAFTPQGAQRWAFEAKMGPPVPPQSPVVGADGTIYLAANRLYAVTAAGERKWAFATESLDSPPAVGADGVVYAASWNGKVYAVAPDGTLAWKFDTGGAVSASPPVIAATGTVFVGTGTAGPDAAGNGNALFAIRASSKGYAASAWPSYQARWMRHGGGQGVVVQAPHAGAPAPASDGNARHSAAREQLGARGIAFAPQRFLECAEVGDAACVEGFLAAGMDPDARDDRGVTALMRALASGQLGIAETLLGNGADPDARNRLGATALHGAAQFGRLEAVRILLAHGADADARDDRGVTPLMRAAYQARLEVVGKLLEAGADPELRARDGSTALASARASKHAGVVALIEGASKRK